VGTDGLQEKAWTAKEKLDMDIIRRDLKDMHTWIRLVMKPKNWRQTEQDGVNVWPNASVWLPDERRSKVKRSWVAIKRLLL